MRFVNRDGDGKSPPYERSRFVTPRRRLGLLDLGPSAAPRIASPWPWDLSGMPRAPEVQRRPPRSAHCPVSTSSATLPARHRHLAALLRRDQAVSQYGFRSPCRWTHSLWGHNQVKPPNSRPCRECFRVREARRGGRLGFPNHAHLRSHDPLAVRIPGDGAVV
jgi:hypothetical protein